MSRPTAADRYAQADAWMDEAFGMSMPTYVISELRMPMTPAIRDVLSVITKSGAQELLEKWRREDALSNAGSKPIFSVSCALTLLLLQMRLGRIPHVAKIARTFLQLSVQQRKNLGLCPDFASQADPSLNEHRSYDQIWAAIHRLILLVDEFYVPEGAPSPRHRRLSGIQYGQLLDMRDPERCERNRKRLNEFVNALIEGSMRLLPNEVLSRWEGNIAGDATLAPMQGKAGCSKSREGTKPKRSVNVDAGNYGRGGNHAGITNEQAAAMKKLGIDIKGLAADKLTWGIEVELARMTPNVTDNRGDFPLLIASAGFHIPGAISSSGAALCESIKNRGHKLNYTIFDRAYPAGFVRDFHHPIRLLGGKLVFDYDKLGFGAKAQDPRGFIQIVGSWFLDNLPKNLREIDKPMVDMWNKVRLPLRELKEAKRRSARAQDVLQLLGRPGGPRNASAAAQELRDANEALKQVKLKYGPLISEYKRMQATYDKQLDEREQYRLIPKGRMEPNGTRRYMVPDTSKVPFAGQQRFTAKTVTITADISADKSPGGLRFEQHLVYGTRQWRKVYGLRNGVESVNRSVKRAQFEDLANPDRRHVRGNTFTYLIAALATVCENIRRIITFLKEQLAIVPLSTKNEDVATNFWQPETGAVDFEVEVDPPPRC